MTVPATSVTNTRTLRVMAQTDGETEQQNAFTPFYKTVETLYKAEIQDLSNQWYTRGFPTTQSIDRFKQTTSLIDQKMHSKNSITENISESSLESNSASSSRHTLRSNRNRSNSNRKTNAQNNDLSLVDLPILVQNKSDRIKHVQIGAHLIDVWFTAPYPEEYSTLETLYICEYCLRYMKSRSSLNRHCLKCAYKNPPGDEIYRDGCISIFEVDGRKNKTYCQSLCLLAKSFLDSKTLYYDVEPFLFYVLTETDDNGCHFVGYFSKEKKCLKEYNLSCIMTLPPFQRKGYGQFLIDFSYMLSRREKKPGSPEKPLSELGLLSYQKYWLDSLQRHLKAQGQTSITLVGLSEVTGMTTDDIITTLGDNKMLEFDEETNGYKITCIEKPTNPNRLYAKEEQLIWTPYLVTNNGDAGILSIPRKTHTNAPLSSSLSRKSSLTSPKPTNSRNNSNRNNNRKRNNNQKNRLNNSRTTSARKTNGRSTLKSANGSISNRNNTGRAKRSSPY